MVRIDGRGDLDLAGRPLIGQNLYFNPLWFACIFSCRKLHLQQDKL